MKATWLMAGLLMFALVMGCESKPVPQPVAQAPVPIQPPPVQPPAVNPQPVPMPAADPNTSVKAEVGVGEKGRDYGGGIITTPVRAYFRTQQRIEFEINIPRAMKEYKALHDDKGPQSHEEFMKEIVEPYGIKLPKLPPGETYLYDPKTELMVQRPRKPGET